MSSTVPDPFASATALRDRLAERSLTAVEAVEASLRQIDTWDASLRAFITVGRESAMARAQALDAEAAPVGPLHGLPIAIKDVTAVEGFATSNGSVFGEAKVETADDPWVARLKAAGAVVIGKTTVPDFGFGSICTSSLRGATRTPYDFALSSEGSSGGSAAAVAAGMVPLATGGDFGGSLRSPASCCGIVSIRPTPGLIPNPARRLAWSNLATDGPLARSVDDAVLLLDAMMALDPRDPLSRPPDAPAPPDSDRLRLAASEDLGVAPVSAEVRSLFQRAVHDLDAALGPVAVDAPDCSGAMDCFMTLRAGIIHDGARHLLDRHGEALPFGVRWNIEQGRELSLSTFLAAEIFRGTLYRRFIAFFDRYDVLLLPAMALMPFDAKLEDIIEIDGRGLDNIVQYYAITYIVSLVGCPVVTLPVGLNDAGLPLGVQLVGRPHGDRALIAAARRIEREVGWRFQPPPLIARAGA